jgi:hypothetical protein
MMQYHCIIRYAPYGLYHSQVGVFNIVRIYSTLGALFGIFAVMITWLDFIVASLIYPF